MTSVFSHSNKTLVGFKELNINNGRVLKSVNRLGADFYIFTYHDFNCFEIENNSIKHKNTLHDRFYS